MVNATGINENHFHKTNDRSAKHIDTKGQLPELVEQAYKDGEKDTQPPLWTETPLTDSGG